MLDEGPSKLYDALAKVLGLDALVDAQATLQQARTTRDKAQKDADQDRKALLPKLEGVDRRARRDQGGAREEGLGPRRPRAVLAGSPTTAGDGRARSTSSSACPSSQPPDPSSRRREAIKALRDAEQRQTAAAQTVAGKSEQLATLLDHALRFHEAHGDGDCPVCGRENALDNDWHQKKAQEAETLQAGREGSHRSEEGRSPRPQAERCRSSSPSTGTSRARTSRQSASATLAEAVLRHAPGRRRRPRATAVESHLPQFISRSRRNSRQAAADELSRREDAWRPHALALAEWLPKARKARKAAEALPLLKAAEKWMKDAADDIRNERFAPIADQTRRIWDQLKLQSNVSLDDVHLGGTGKARKVELNVTVDGQEGAALGVMSQGELHSLALSLFIPRATLAESPFRFVVIDDPVQSMDPARVDGLARVLQSASKDRQVVVFTHDDRLPEAIRRLDIDATVIEVTRREGSVVEPRRSKDPVSRYIEDAMALAYTDDLPPEVARRVVPGLCREALEAACMEADPPPPHRQGRAPRRGGGAAAEAQRHEGPRRPRALRRREARRRRPPAPQPEEQGSRRHLPRRQRRQPRSPARRP